MLFSEFYFYDGLVESPLTPLEISPWKEIAGVISGGKWTLQRVAERKNSLE